MVRQTNDEANQAYYHSNYSPALIEPNPNYKPPFIPHALCLTVFLSTSSFVHTRDKATMRAEMNDVKIDVYYNGALCGSHYVPRRYSGEAYNMTEHIVRFTGRRIGRLIEKPWIIVPSGQNPNGGLREYRRGKVAYAGAQQRWNDISSSLLAEADKAGRDGQGERPIIGEYLESLAQLSMPKEVEDMQKAGSPKIGIFDVVVIWGKGSKDGPDAPYIIEPTQIRNEGCTSINLDRVVDHSPVQKVTTMTDNTNTAPPQSRSEAPANARSVDDYSYAYPPSVTTFPVPTPNSNTDLLATFPLKQHLFRTLPYETPVKRSRGHYYDVLTTKKTLSEEINSIATGTVFDSKTGFDPTFSTNVRTTRASHASTAGISPISSCPMTRNHTPSQTKIVIFKLPSSTNSATSPSVMNTLRVQDGEADNKFLIPPRERNPAPGSKRKERAATLPTAEDLDRGFLTPVLSTDCVTTYAPVGVVRNVVAARGGVFKEGGVVMGTRFVVGW